ncbi:MAG: LemA family protein, partial [Candidatus Thiodiazotropha sp. (ex Ustalcina ferruginea)]|nr:LemA family protein [Candidatus Thiodiazotropha sp. (ex Ustalcina ferruginea)]
PLRDSGYLPGPYACRGLPTFASLSRVGSVGEAEQGLSGALGRLFALAEAYPDLKANENMMQLSEELVSTENKVAFARQAYNDSVMQYNIDRELFPSNLISSWFRFQAAALLEIEDEVKREVPKVSFN